MILAPQLQIVRSTMRSLWVFLPVALGYLALLVYAWSPDTLSILLPGSLSDVMKGSLGPQFIPKLPGIQELFSRPPTAASLVLHVAAINLFLGRSIFFDGTLHSRCVAWGRGPAALCFISLHLASPAGLAFRVPTGLSLLVAFVFGPLGLILHWLTKASAHSSSCV